MTPTSQPPETKKLNPQITDFEVGICDLRKIKIYPLSLGDQLELSDLIKQTLQAFFQVEDDNEESLEAFMTFALNLIKENITKVLKLIALDDDPDVVLKELSNKQVEDLGLLIYKINFESLKNLKSLFEKLTKGVLPTSE